MELLILGGGVFLGRACLDAALRAGHRVTVFNRGQARSDWPAEVEILLGDRKTDLVRLGGPPLGRGRRHLWISAA